MSKTALGLELFKGTARWCLQAWLRAQKGSYCRGREAVTCMKCGNLPGIGFMGHHPSGDSPGDRSSGWWRPWTSVALGHLNYVLGTCFLPILNSLPPSRAWHCMSNLSWLSSLSRLPLTILFIPSHQKSHYLLFYSFVSPRRVSMLHSSRTLCFRNRKYGVYFI